MENLYGLQKSEAGDYKGAIEEFDKAIKREPNKSSLFYNRGRAYQSLNDFKTAIADFKQALKINNFKEKNKYGITLMEIGSCFGGLMELDSCLKYYKKTLALDPASDLMLLNIAFIYDMKGDTNEVRGFLNKVKTVDPEFQKKYSELKGKYKI